MAELETLIQQKIAFAKQKIGDIRQKIDATRQKFAAFKQRCQDTYNRWIVKFAPLIRLWKYLAGHSPETKPTGLPTNEPPSHFIRMGEILTPAWFSHDHTYTSSDPNTHVIAFGPKRRKKHIYLLGASGTGKTTAMLRLIESDIAAGRTLCVIDLKGDLIDWVLKRVAHEKSAEEWGSKLALIDLRQQDYIVGFNPLQGHDEDDVRIKRLMSVFKRQSFSWGIQLEETLRNSLMALAQSGYTLLELEPLLTNPGFRAQVLTKVTDRTAKAFFRRYDGFSRETQATYSNAVINKVTPLISGPQLEMIFGQKRCIPLERLLNVQKGSVILIALGVRRLSDSAHLMGGFFISAIQAALSERGDDIEKVHNPVHIYVDEFARMANEQFEEFFEQGRRFNFGTCLGHQNLTQLPRDLRSLILNNFHLQFYFQTGGTDAKELAKEIISTEFSSERQIRSALINQKVGEAMVVMRGHTSVRVRLYPYEHPKVTAAQIAALKRASWKAYAQPNEVVKREIAQRDAAIEQLANTGTGNNKGKYRGNHKDQAPVAPATYEIRHTPKPDRFPPHPKRRRK